MASVRELLLREVERLSEKDASEVIELLKRKKPTEITPEKPEVAREELIRRAAGHPGIRVPDPNIPPFEKFEPIECPGIPASELLIRDRR